MHVTKTHMKRKEEASHDSYSPHLFTIDHESIGDINASLGFKTSYSVKPKVTLTGILHLVNIRGVGVGHG